MVVLASVAVLATSVAQEVDAVRLVWTLRECVPAGLCERRMVELARLPEFARPVLEEILAYRFSGSKREERFPRVRLPYAAARLNVEGVVVLAGVAVLATTGTKVVATLGLAGTLGVR